MAGRSSGMMTPGDLAREWQSGTIHPVYGFWGPESDAKARALDRLKSLLKLDAFNLVEFPPAAGVTAAELRSALWTMPVFAERRLVALKNPKTGAEAKKILVEYLQNPSPQTVLVVFSDDSKIDAKDDIQRELSRAGKACLFAPLREGDAVEFVRRRAKEMGRELDEEAAWALVSEAGTSAAILFQEIEKAALFNAGGGMISKSDVLACLGFQKSYDPFALGRSVALRDRAAALKNLGELFAQGRPEEQAFKALYQVSAALLKQLKALRMMRAGRSREEIYKALRLHPYWDKDYLESAGRISEKAAAAALRRCLQTEADLKSKSWLDATFEIKRLVASVCRMAPRSS